MTLSEGGTVAETPIQQVRVEQDLWNAGKAKAAREGRKLPEVLRYLLIAWVKGGLVVDVEGRIAVIHDYGDADRDG